MTTKTNTKLKALITVMLFAVSGCSGSGDSSGVNNGSVPSSVGEQGAGSVMQLMTTESIYYNDPKAYSRSALYYTTAGDKIAQWAKDAVTSYFYDADGRVIQQEIEYPGLMTHDSIFYTHNDAGQIAKKEYMRTDRTEPSHLFMTVTFTYDLNGNVIEEKRTTPYSIDNNGAVIHEESTTSTIKYIYAYKDYTQTELILIRKKCTSPGSQVMVYFRYDSASKKLRTVEYDWDNDFNIDSVMYVVYDDQGNRILDEVYDYNDSGNEELSMMLYYTWEESYIAENLGFGLAAFGLTTSNELYY